MGFIDEDVIEDIKARIDIVDVIGATVHLKKAGGTWKACCPFHQEKTPSFSVDQKRQSYKCFGCGEGGNAFSFIMKQQAMDFPTAARFLAQKAGVTIPEKGGKKGPRGPSKERLQGLCLEAANFFRKELLEDKASADARAYIDDRKLNDETAEEFLVGYAPNEWEKFLKYAREAGYRDEELEATGLTTVSEKTPDRPRDRFRDRIMFPIRDGIGNVIGFSGRILKKDASPAKYINSPETILFKKSRVLFGLDRAKEALVKDRVALVCEGQIDVIRCHQFGVKNAVAAQGTALTVEQATILKRFVDEVVLVLDADKAGINAALRSGENFMGQNLSLKVAKLPEGDDPDTILLNKGKEAFDEIIATAKPFIEFQLDVLTDREDASTETGMRNISKAVLETTARSKTAVQREQLLQSIGDRLNIPVEALREDLQSIALPQIQQDRDRDKKRQQRAKERESHGAPLPQVALAAPAKKTSLAEEELLILFLKHPQEVHQFTDVIAPQMFDSAACEEIFGHLCGLEPEATPDQVHLSLNDLEGSSKELIDKSRSDTRQIQGELGTHQEAIQDCVVRVRRELLKREREVLRYRMTSAGPKEKAQLQMNSAKLTTAMKELQVATQQGDWTHAKRVLTLYAPKTV